MSCKHKCDGNCSARSAVLIFWRQFGVNSDTGHRYHFKTRHMNMTDVVTNLRLHKIRKQSSVCLCAKNHTIFSRVAQNTTNSLGIEWVSVSWWFQNGAVHGLLFWQALSRPFHNFREFNFLSLALPNRCTRGIFERKSTPHLSLSNVGFFAIVHRHRLTHDPSNIGRPAKRTRRICHVTACSLAPWRRADELVSCCTAVYPWLEW